MGERTVFVADDFDLTETMDSISEKLRDRKIRVIRGPETIKGKKLEYPPERFEELFGKAEVAMFSSRSICSRAIMEAAPRLRGIVNPTIGVDTVDLKAADDLGIIVGNGAIPANYTGMAEATFMLMLMLLYNPARSQAVLRDNLPKPVESEHWQLLLSGRTVGLVGLGRIARGIAQRLAGWEAEIIAYDPFVPQDKAPAGVTMVSLDDLCRTSDIVNMCVVVTDETRNMVNDHFLSLMKPSAFLINTSRGQVVDEAALCRALSEKRIAGAALDTFQIEPLPADSPLRKLDNVILTPHLVGHTRECVLGFPDAAVENITNILNGEPPVYCVNPDVIPKWRERLAKLETK